jgi:hypothetical protein
VNLFARRRNGTAMNSPELERIEREDPTVLKVFIAEYLFFKKDIEKAYVLFSEVYKDPALSPIMKKSVETYLVTISRELRKKEIEHINFKITAEYDFGGLRNTVAVITKDTFSENPKQIGDLLELLDFNLKNQQAGE